MNKTFPLFSILNKGVELHILSTAYLLQNRIMIKQEELVTMRAIALCFKPFLKPEEALIFCNLGRTQFAKKCEEYGLFKNENGYYKREDIEKMLGGEKVTVMELPIRKRR